MTALKEYLLVYDVSGSSDRLRKVAKLCEQHGFRAQSSVFELKLTDAQYLSLLSRLEEVIKESNDNVIVYSLHKDCLSSALRIGHQRLLHPKNDYLF